MHFNDSQNVSCILYFNYILNTIQAKQALPHFQGRYLLDKQKQTFIYELWDSLVVKSQSTFSAKAMRTELTVILWFNFVPLVCFNVIFFWPLLCFRKSFLDRWKLKVMSIWVSSKHVLYILYIAICGADFHRAMVATAPGEKLLTWRRPMRNWTHRTISSLFCAENTSALRKINKNCCYQSCTF